MGRHLHGQPGVGFIAWDAQLRWHNADIHSMWMNDMGMHRVDMHQRCALHRINMHGFGMHVTGIFGVGLKSEVVLGTHTIGMDMDTTGMVVLGRTPY